MILNIFAGKKRKSNEKNRRARENSYKKERKKGALTRYGTLTWESVHACNLIILFLLIAWGYDFIVYGAFEFLCISIGNL